MVSLNSGQLLVCCREALKCLLALDQHHHTAQRAKICYIPGVRLSLLQLLTRKWLPALGFLTLKAMSFFPIKIRFKSLNKQLLNILFPHLTFVNGTTVAEHPKKAMHIFFFPILRYLTFQKIGGFLHIQNPFLPTKFWGYPVQTKPDLHVISLACSWLSAPGSPSTRFSICFCFLFLIQGNTKFWKSIDFTEGLSSKAENEHWCHSNWITLARMKFLGHYPYTVKSFNKFNSITVTEAKDCLSREKRAGN